jgi:hypothetical protein
VVTIVPIGPGEDEDEREKCRDARFYNATGVIVHWSCATGKAPQ